MQKCKDGEVGCVRVFKVFYLLQDRANPLLQLSQSQGIGDFLIPIAVDLLREIDEPTVQFSRIKAKIDHS